MHIHLCELGLFKQFSNGREQAVRVTAQPVDALGVAHGGTKHGAQRLHDGIVASAVADHDQSEPLQRLGQHQTQLGILLCQFLIGILELDRLVVAMQLHD